MDKKRTIETNSVQELLNLGIDVIPGMIIEARDWKDQNSYNTWDFKVDSNHIKNAKRRA